MSTLTKTTDISRQLIIILSKHIHENKPKLNLLSTCKFLYMLRFGVFYYQRVIIRNDTDPKILSRLTNTHYIIKSKQPLSKIFSYTASKIKNMFMPMSYIMTENYTLSEIINQNLFQIKDLDILLPNNLTHLKLTGNINFDLVFGKLPPNLKSLIINSQLNNFPNDKIKMLSASIEHLGLYVDDISDISNDVAKKIIPINIKCLEFNKNNLVDILCEYPALTKIKYDAENDGIKSIKYLKNIPTNITSISYFEEQQEYSFKFSIFLLNISNNVNTLHINHYTSEMYETIPPTISRLKINNTRTRILMIPRSVKELRIKKIIQTNNELLYIISRIKKLIINFKDRHLLDPHNHSEYIIVYKY